MHIKLADNRHYHLSTCENIDNHCKHQWLCERCIIMVMYVNGMQNVTHGSCLLVKTSTIIANISDCAKDALLC